MGGIVQIQFIMAGEVSPMINSHWIGEDAPTVLCRLRDQTEAVCGRGDELSFVAARCVQQLLVDDWGATGLRIANAPAVMTTQDHIDGANMFVVEIGERWRVRHIFGYDDQVAYPIHPKIDWQYEGPAWGTSPSP